MCAAALLGAVVDPPKLNADWVAGAAVVVVVVAPKENGAGFGGVAVEDGVDVKANEKGLFWLNIFVFESFCFFLIEFSKFFFFKLNEFHHKL